MSDKDTETKESTTAQEGRTPTFCTLFAVWFKPDHGARRYQEYLIEASPIAESYGARRIESLVPIEVFYGDWHPDYVYLVTWPSKEHFYSFLKDPHYRAVARILSEAVQKTDVLFCLRY